MLLNIRALNCFVLRFNSQLCSFLYVVKVLEFGRLLITSFPDWTTRHLCCNTDKLFCLPLHVCATNERSDIMFDASESDDHEEESDQRADCETFTSSEELDYWPEPEIAQSKSYKSAVYKSQHVHNGQNFSLRHTFFALAIMLRFVVLRQNRCTWSPPTCSAS